MKTKILTVGILPILLLASVSMMLGNDTHSAKASVTVTVTNVSDVVNGNTSNIAALISNPGPDGISFREALYASNGTIGQKTITFHQSLSGATITFAVDGELLLLSGGG